VPGRRLRDAGVPRASILGGAQFGGPTPYEQERLRPRALFAPSAERLARWREETDSRYRKEYRASPKLRTRRLAPEASLHINRERARRPVP
jgi:hypothetical protein